MSALGVAQTPELIAVIEGETINTGFGKRIMPLGDQNGDGFADLMVADVIGRAFFYYGTSSTDTLVSPELMFEEVTYVMNNIGDVGGDGIDDFLIPRYVGGAGKLDLYYGGPEIDTMPEYWFGLDDRFGQGYSAIGFDFNQNGHAEIVSFSSQSYATLFYDLAPPIDSVHDLRLTPANLQPAIDYSNFGNIPIVGDFNGEGPVDLALGLRRRWAAGLSGAVYLYWGGSGFDTIPNLILERPAGYIDGAESFGADVLANAGDLNGDGYDDIFASSSRSGDDSLGFVFFGGPGIDAEPDVITVQPHYVARAAGDINHDGFDDLILGYGIDLLEYGGVFIYYGGLDMDSIPDIVFTNSGTPGPQTDFGLDVTGVGDFNNDGLNDFAFSLEDGYSVEKVLIYSGSDVSSVDYTYDPILPSDYSLSHNYPNPFNPSTTIKFSLPTRSEVTLTVYNILGAEVIRLTEGTLSAGRYTVRWDGADRSGSRVASGVYLYRLQAEKTALTRKMMLLK